MTEYDAVAHGKLDCLDYQASRPFMAWKRPDLLERIEEWLDCNPPRLELATLALEELRIRGRPRASAAERLFRSAELEPIPWLSEARRSVRETLQTSSSPRGRGRLYVILRGGYTAQSGLYGAYVGVTSKPVEVRFLEHRQGIRSARGLQQHGIELLYSLFTWANPIPGSSESRRQLETRLHEMLRCAIPKVSGDRILEPKASFCRGSNFRPGSTSA